MCIRDRGNDVQTAITVKGDGIDGEITFTLEQLKAMPDANFEHIYSTINNWPSAKTYAARGVKLKSILQQTDVLETAQVITVRSPDSYEVSFTREQLLDAPQYYFPNAQLGDATGAQQVEPILAYEYLSLIHI